jgi:hypothetical protein
MSDNYLFTEEIGRDINLLRSTVKRNVHHSLKLKKYRGLLNEGGDSDSLYREKMVKY